ncbi:hypothetical protein X474_14670 [Dethiosulfatarculus sandiegensis]|uniref:Uncharacterized protein n=1 Tax=Dethiosulfatarculus sandiegensis TaxID=1429043 RepID=A0A0D2J545_9BACT|nr:hypothetical protein X474_14670 [Dethiosulfatarculus sandiegensis]
MCSLPKVVWAISGVGKARASKSRRHNTQADRACKTRWKIGLRRSFIKFFPKFI